jgi:hypothetical protein
MVGAAEYRIEAGLAYVARPVAWRSFPRSLRGRD